MVTCFVVPVLLTCNSTCFFIEVFNQLHAKNLFHNKFYFLPLHVSSTCAHHQDVKIALHSLWCHHTETSEWSKITNFTTICSYLSNYILVILDHSLVSV